MSEVQPVASVADSHQKDYRIIVNGEEHTVTSGIVSYEEVVKLGVPGSASPKRCLQCDLRKGQGAPRR